MKTYSVFDVADFFRALTNQDEGDLLSNLKLQKLCYYAQGVATAVRDEPLFPQKLEAWTHGPVVPDLYHAFKEWGGGSIPPPESFDSQKFHQADLDLLNDVYDTYGQYSAWKLRDMTHGEAPWVNAYRNTFDKVITVDALKDYFSNEVSDSYKAAYHEKIR